MSLTSKYNSGSEVLEEIEKNIDLHHEAFLATENPEKKAEALRYFEGYARQYLYLVPHNQKFKFNETERVLHQSAMSIGDFDPREASLAFECLAQYGHNLLCQPWRKDFQIIKLTSGYYVHNISAHLENAHEILIAMGYVNISDEALKLLPNFDPKILKAVSRDCLVSSQECLILSQLWSRVSDQEPTYPLTTGELFEFRKQNKGNVDLVCKTLICDIRRRHQDYKIHKSQKHDDSIDGHMEGEISASTTKGISKKETNQRMEEALQDITLEEDSQHIYDAVCNEVPLSKNKTLSPTSPSSSSSSKNVLLSSVVTPTNLLSRGSTSQSKSMESKRQVKEERNVSSFITSTAEIGCNLYSNISPKESNYSTESRGKTKWHTPQRIKLHPRGHLRFSKVNENEVLLSEKLNSIESSQLTINQQIADAVVEQKSKILSSKPPIELYEDEHFPRVRHPDNSYIYNGETLGEDTLNEAYAYAREVNELTPRDSIHNQTLRHPDEVKSSKNSGLALENDYKSSSEYSDQDFSSGKKSTFSTDASSWDLKMGNKNYRHPHQAHDYYDASDSSFMENSGTKTTNCPTYVNISPYNKHATAYHPAQNVTRISANSGANIPKNYNSKLGYREGEGFRSEFQGQDELISRCVRREKTTSTKGSLFPSTTPLRQTQALNSLEDVWYHRLLNKKPDEEEYAEDINEDTAFSEENEPRFSENSGYVGYRDIKKRNRMDMDTEEYDDVDVVDSRVRSDMNYCSKSVTRNEAKYDDSAYDTLHKKQYKNSPTEKYLNISKVTEGTVKGKDTAAKSTVAATAKTSDSKSSKFKKVPVIGNVSVVEIEPWNCKFCTYINTKETRICEMCAKSKDFIDESCTGLATDIPKLYSLSTIENDSKKEPKIQNNSQVSESSVITSDTKMERISCPQCTYSNPHTARVCEICDIRLRAIESPSRSNWLEELN